MTTINPDRTVRTYVIRLTKEGRRFGSVTFDRHGTNASVFKNRDDASALNHAISSAMHAGIPCVPEGTCLGYEVEVAYEKPVYDAERDRYVDPVTRVENAECRQKRLIEESSALAMYGD